MNAASDASKAATQLATQQAQETTKNPEFLDKLRDPDVNNSELYNWLEDEIGPALSGAHIIANRGPAYEQEIKWLNLNKSERIIAEGNPGRLCSDSILAVAQGVVGRPDKDVVTKRTQDERRVVRDAMDVATSLQSLGVENRGLKAVSEVTTSTEVKRNEETQSSGIKAKLSRFYD